MSTPRALRTGPESPKTSGQPRGPWKPSASHPGLLVDPSGTRTQARFAREIWSTPGALGPSARSLGQLFDTVAPNKVQSLPGCLSKPWALGHGPESPERLVDPTDLRIGPESPAKEIDIAGIQSLARVSRESWSNPRAFGPRPEWPVTTGRHRGHSELGRSRPGHLVDPA